MKVRLVQPSQLDENGRPTKYSKLFMPFLTIPTLAGLTPSGVEIGVTNDYVEDIDFDEEVDLVAITAHTSQAPRAYQIADEFRKRGRKTALGGVHPSACPEEALKHAGAVVVGEAENVWEQVLSDARAGTLAGIYKANERPDLSRLVVPRFDLVNYGNYVIPPFARTPLLPLQTARGCPNDCEFCSVTGFLGRKMRTKPVANVMREIESCKPSRVFFTDDNIAGDLKHARELFAALKDLKMRWACQMSASVSEHPDLIELAAEAGCHETFIGIESISEDTLKSANKKFNKPGKYAELLERLKEVGILAQVSLIYGLDGDNAESLRKTIDEVLTWDANYMYLFMLTPFPGTKLHERMTRENRVLKDDWSLYDAMHPVIRFKDASAEELIEAMWESYRKFYSAGNVARRALRFMKQYIIFFPRDMLIEELFFQGLIRKVVGRRQHPFSLGYEKENGQ